MRPRPSFPAKASGAPQAAVDGIMRVMDAAFDPAYGEAWTRRQISDALLLPSTHALLVDADGALTDGVSSLPKGFVLSRHAADEEELLLIAVTPDVRTRGLGKILIDRLFEAAAIRGVNWVFLEMRRGNPAIHLYRKVGFEPVGERPNYYKLLDGSRVDAITFRRSLSSTV
ncbi:MAG: GNAT family N-acetyltransferase [Pseudomonadota bacterium]